MPRRTTATHRAVGPTGVCVEVAVGRLPVQTAAQVEDLCRRRARRAAVARVVRRGVEGHHRPPSEGPVPRRDKLERVGRVRAPRAARRGRQCRADRRAGAARQRGGRRAQPRIRTRTRSSCPRPCRVGVLATPPGWIERYGSARLRDRQLVNDASTQQGWRRPRSRARGRDAFEMALAAPLRRGLRRACSSRASAPE